MSETEVSDRPRDTPPWNITEWCQCTDLVNHQRYIPCQEQYRKYWLKKRAVKHCHLKNQQDKENNLRIQNFKVNMQNGFFINMVLRVTLKYQWFLGYLGLTVPRTVLLIWIFFIKWLFNEIEGYFSHWHLKCIKQKKQQWDYLLSVFSSSLFLFTSSDCFSPSCSATFKNTYKYMINFSVKFFLQ